MSMKYLQKTWIRIVVSLLCGGIISELIHILTGTPNRPKGSASTLIIGFIAYCILRYYTKKAKS
ncbi:hypothetical protein CAP35_09420 [Chitinophagaceae bacterium IBVUCB1]|nr:hypothetical protein CAP35_09420 [Chitinophagaceae bacterium IBVUCB1]